MTNDAAVAWEERHRGPDGEWRAWTPCSKAYFDGYANSDNYQTRALAPATTVAKLRARIAELEGLLSDTVGNLRRMANDEFADCEQVRLEHVVNRIEHKLARTSP